jgi:hypothetical protein
MKYDAAYFIKKFKAIPDMLWVIGSFKNCNGACCALGHCGVREFSTFDTTSEEAKCLIRLFSLKDEKLGLVSLSRIATINDGVFNTFIGSTPKMRVLSALESIK